MISVIVPVYNVEKYVGKCIESILKQTYTDFELILVNDGSTDHSYDICCEYKKKDSRIKIINKKNGSVNKYFIINKETNNDLIPKFGITFVKNMCNAVNRNKLKRQIKSIIDNNKNIYENNKNYIIIIRKDALNKSYKELEDNLISLFNKLKEKKDER